MLMKKFPNILLAACVVLSFVTVPLCGQGVLRREYTGLDKYISQGRADDASFVGVRAAEFLTIPIGARAIGMGSAYSAVADDISSIWWNPAGLGFLENSQVMFTVVDYTMDYNYSYLAGATPVADGRVVLGCFLGYMNYPQMEITTVSQPNGTGSYFNAYDFQMGGSLAYTFSDRFMAGINVKYVHQDVFNNISGNAFAIDAGGIYHTTLMNREVKFAFAIQNLGTNIQMSGPNMELNVGPETPGGSVPDGYGSYGDDPDAISRRESRRAAYVTHTYHLPTSVKMAVSYNVFTSENANLLVSGEIWRNSSIPISYSTGTEMNYNFTPYLSGSLRTGWKIQTDEYDKDADDFGYTYLGDDPTFRGLSFGGGIKRMWADKSIEFSYAYRNKGRLSADNFFTVTFGF
jgi:Type IX secretion system protein PorV